MVTLIELLNHDIEAGKFTAESIANANLTEKLEECLWVVLSGISRIGPKFHKLLIRNRTVNERRKLIRKVYPTKLTLYGWVRDVVGAVVAANPSLAMEFTAVLQGPRQSREDDGITLLPNSPQEKSASQQWRGVGEPSVEIVSNPFLRHQQSDLPVQYPDQDLSDLDNLGTSHSDCMNDFDLELAGDAWSQTSLWQTGEFMNFDTAWSLPSLEGEELLTSGMDDLITQIRNKRCIRVSGTQPLVMTCTSRQNLMCFDEGLTNFEQSPRLLCETPLHVSSSKEKQVMMDRHEVAPVQMEIGSPWIAASLLNGSPSCSDPGSDEFSWVRPSSKYLIRFETTGPVELLSQADERSLHAYLGQYGDNRSDRDMSSSSKRHVQRS